MRRGTTPTVIIALSGVDINDFQSVYVTIKQDKTEMTKTGSNLQIENGKIYVYLTQEDTLQFKGGYANIQVRAVTKGGLAVASNIKRLQINEILKEGVIT